MSAQFEIDMNDLEEALAKGDIPLSEYNRQVREMEKSYRLDAEEAAEAAYDAELNRW